MTLPSTPITPSRLRTLALASLLALAACGQAAHSQQAVNVAQAQQQFSTGEAVLIDVREPDEFAMLRAPGAKLIPLGQLAQRLSELPQDKSKPVLLVCRSGNRSGVAAGILAKAGYTRAINVSGGMKAWEQQGLPVLRGPSAP